MSWCPDPRCGVAIPDEHWSVEDLAYEHAPFDAERGEAWMWRATCPGCGQFISALHGEADESVIEPACGDWCCPLCGGAVRVIGENRGPVKVALRCKGTCGALISIRREGIR